MGIPIIATQRRGAVRDRAAESAAADAAEVPVLVLGCSLGTSHAMWSQVIDLIESEFAEGDGYEILTWDLPGHGDSPASTEPFTISDLADAVIAAVDAEFGPEAPFVYAGDSVGGQVAYELAVRGLPRLRAAVPVCSAPVIGTPQGWADRAEVIRTQGVGAMVEGSRQRWFGPGFVDEHPELAQSLLDALPGVDADSYIHLCGALAAFDVREALPHIHTPLIIVLGEDDQAVPVDDAAEPAAIVRTGVAVVLPEVGHLAPVEAPDDVAGILLSVLDDPTSAIIG